MIRRYQPNDWNCICGIYDRAKPYELRAAGVESSFVPLMQDEVRTTGFKQHQVYVWDNAGTVEGFAGFKDTYIGWLFVEPARFRRGIGRALLAHIVSEIEGVPWLWAMQSNETALRFYSDSGFNVVEERQTTNGGLPCVAVKLELRKQSSTVSGA